MESQHGKADLADIERWAMPLKKGTVRTLLYALDEIGLVRKIGTNRYALDTPTAKSESSEREQLLARLAELDAEEPQTVDAPVDDDVWDIDALRAAVLDIIGMPKRGGPYAPLHLHDTLGLSEAATRRALEDGTEPTPDELQAALRRRPRPFDD
jgi:hypothetical protein